MPIDEMLGDLRSVLEGFENNPSHDAFGDVQKELCRIGHFCEDMLVEVEDD